ncbi:hypothetical protein CMQ_6669 [Grosmannia clavigera kw1407]|uniref:Uncharacterized protein n=1 Tax=Grosmannia clavigera (strain kw1407 / UAMH 11150) TaxID=655863 RepID=F0X6V9_GROCL|nr:uncharacterized protein CMQ_6669 [Grosmannia clavigera kw1407]EFX06348.1 hypothetical protein CMQ_6669 [Grosmannia clavigera kw1407]
MTRTRLQQKGLTDGLSQNGHYTQKEPKRTGQLYRRNFPPTFWDSLSRVPLTRRALGELDRRNSIRGAPGPAELTASTADLVRFARHGGADLRHLRGVWLQGLLAKDKRGTDVGLVSCTEKNGPEHDFPPPCIFQSPRHADRVDRGSRSFFYNQTELGVRSCFPAAYD